MYRGPSRSKQYTHVSHMHVHVIIMYLPGRACEGRAYTPTAGGAPARCAIYGAQQTAGGGIYTFVNMYKPMYKHVTFLGAYG